MPMLDQVRDLAGLVLTLAAAVGLLWRAFRVRQRIDQADAAGREHATRLDQVDRDIHALRVEHVTLATELRGQRDDLAQAWASIRALNESAMRRAGNGGGHGHAGTLARGGDHAATASDKKQ